MNIPSRRAARMTGTVALLLTALAPHPAGAQMLGGMGAGLPGSQNQGVRRLGSAPALGAAGPVMTAPQAAGPVGPRFSAPPVMGGGLPFRTMGPTPGVWNGPRGLPGGGGFAYGAAQSFGMALPAAPVYGPQNDAPSYAGPEPSHLRRYGSGGDSAPMRLTAPRSAPFGMTAPPPAPERHVVTGDGRFNNPGINNSINNSFNNGGYVYAPVVAVGGPPLLGGYYYGNYCDTYYGPSTLPTVYSVYDGFPQYIYDGPGMTITTYANVGVLPTYVDPPQAFQAPQYTVNYNQTNYYVTNDAKAADLEAGGDRAKAALPQAFPADSYQAALADIERAWTEGDLTLLKNHFKSDDTKISVSLRDKYKYSLDSSDFGQITRDAFDRLNTTSFKFTEVRKAKNGDVTGFGKHVYTVGDTGQAASGDLTPFDSSAPSADAPDAATGAAGAPKTVYVSYTLRHGDGVWYIVGINSSPDPLAKQ